MKQVQIQHKSDLQEFPTHALFSELNVEAKQCMYVLAKNIPFYMAFSSKEIKRNHIIVSET